MVVSSDRDVSGQHRTEDDRSQPFGDGTQAAVRSWTNHGQVSPSDLEHVNTNGGRGAANNLHWSGAETKMDRMIVSTDSAQRLSGEKLVNQ